MREDKKLVNLSLSYKNSWFAVYRDYATEALQNWGLLRKPYRIRDYCDRSTGLGLLRDRLKG